MIRHQQGKISFLIAIQPTRRLCSVQGLHTQYISMSDELYGLKWRADRMQPKQKMEC